jgi:hypothetical protein
MGELLGSGRCCRRSGIGIFGRAHRLVAGEQRAQRVDGDVAELGRDRDEVVRACRLSRLAALDVAPDEGRDGEVLLGSSARSG